MVGYATAGQGMVECGMVGYGMAGHGMVGYGIIRDDYGDIGIDIAEEPVPDHRIHTPCQPGPPGSRGDEGAGGQSAHAG